jgi:hypothetical protein
MKLGKPGKRQESDVTTPPRRSNGVVTFNKDDMAPFLQKINIFGSEAVGEECGGETTVARQRSQENPGFTQIPPWGLNPGPS